MSRSTRVAVAEPVAQSSRAQAQQPLRALHRPVEPLSAAEALALPALNGPDVICRIDHISPSRFARKDREGTYDFLKVTPSTGKRRFSGELIRRWIAGEPLYEPSFGRKAGR